MSLGANYQKHVSSLSFVTKPTRGLCWNAVEGSVAGLFVPDVLGIMTVSKISMELMNLHQTRTVRDYRY